MTLTLAAPAPLERTINPLLAPPPAVETNLAGVPEGLRHVTVSKQRLFIEQLRVKNAAKALQALPTEAESIHIIANGNFAAWDFVPAILQLADPATIVRLDIATLGFNNRVTAQLLALLDAGRITEVWLLFSCYFRDASKPEAQNMVDGLATRNGRCAATRNHAKLILAELSDGRHIVIEASANMRSCKNIEQFVVSNDRGLLLFHRGWIEGVIDSNGDTTEGAADGSREHRAGRTAATGKPERADRRLRPVQAGAGVPVVPSRRE